MIRNFARRLYALTLTILFTAILIVSIASVPLAQVTGAGQPSAKPYNVSSSEDGHGPAQAPHPPSASVESVPPANPARNRRTDAGAMDLGNPPIFLPAAIYDFGNFSPTSVAVADLDGDGRPDMIVGGIGNGEMITVVLGNGDGTFRRGENHALVNTPLAIAIADLNGDSKLDLVLGYAGAVSVLLGNGDGTFQAELTYASGGTDLISLALADVNGDGKLDALVSNQLSANGGTSTLGVLLGNGDGTFRPPLIYNSAGYRARSVAVADVNRDGKPDLLVANWCPASSCTDNSLVAVLLGNGDGTFQPALTFDAGGDTAISIWAGDVNGDGEPDLLVASNCQAKNDCATGVLAVLFGNGDGTFQAPVDFILGVNYIQALAVRDLNGDRYPDVVVTNGSCDSGVRGVASVLLGNGDGTFQSATAYDSGGYDAMAVALYDVNADDRPDLFMANYCTQNNPAGSVAVLLNNAGASLTTTTIVSNANPAVLRQIVTYTATVAAQSGTLPTGTVKFQDSSRTVATVTLAGYQAAYSTKYTAAGTHSISAVYTGDLNHAGSTSASLTEYIQGPSKTALTTSGSPSFVGQPVTFTAAVTSRFGRIPDGERVTFYDRTTTLGSVALAGGMASYTTSTLAAKSHYVKATYGGDPILLPSTGHLLQVVNKYPTTTTLNSSPNPSAHGQAVTFTAAVVSAGSGMPTGKVTFQDGAIGIGTAVLSGGVAKLTKNKLAVGTHPITAQYLGDAASAKSTSSVLDQVVQ